MAHEQGPPVNRPPLPTVPWAAAWGVAASVISMATLTVYAMVDSFPWGVVVVVWWPPIAVLFHLPMTLIAGGLRGIWVLLASDGIREARAESVVLGVVAAPAGFAVFWLVARVELPWQLVVSPPVLAAGVGAGVLAHEWISPVSWRYWRVVTIAVVAGLALWFPLEAAFGWQLL
jgi:hypothetical protein